MSVNIWQQCLDCLATELPSQQFNTWIKPLQVEISGNYLNLVAPNRFIRDWVKDKFLQRIKELTTEFNDTALPYKIEINTSAQAAPLSVVVKPESLSSDRYTSTVDAQTTENKANSSKVQAINTQSLSGVTTAGAAIDNHVEITGNVAAYNNSAANLILGVDNSDIDQTTEFTDDEMISADTIANTDLPIAGLSKKRSVNVEGGMSHQSSLISNYTFETFVEGKSNQLARAAAMQVTENPGGAYNPLFLYGASGLGKTHLMHAVGNELLKQKRDAKIVYLHSERFVADMVKAVQLNAINDFKRYYRSVDALLIDDIQFFAGKEKSQEEFFHTFNALLEGGQQMILTCDRYPKEISGLEERLKSRFGWGLTIAVEPPELETRVAILMKKAEQSKIELPHEAAFFIAQRIRSNVRELEGALKRVIAHAQFKSKKITIELVRDSLKDLIALQDRQVSIDNIQKIVADYYKIKVSDLLSKRRSRSVARPRQMAMSLAKELTNHSLPEIGDGFGGRDHTTVLHACRKIKELRDESSDISEDYKNLSRLLMT